MQKPNGFDDVQTNNEWKPIELGGHYLRIMKAEERKNKNGGDMLVVAFDFAPNDKQPNYFMDSFKADTREGKKWPNAGTKYINVNDYEGNCSRDFKSFCTCVERSNAGFKINWDAKDFCAQFKGKLIGGNFGLVENEYNGDIRKRAELRWWLETNRVDGAPIPKEKLLNASRPQPSGQAPVSGMAKAGMVQTAQPTNAEELDIPF